MTCTKGIKMNDPMFDYYENQRDLKEKDEYCYYCDEKYDLALAITDDGCVLCCDICREAKELNDEEE